MTIEHLQKAIELLKGREQIILEESGKAYTKVQDRIEVFREVYGDTLGIRTAILTQPPYRQGNVFLMRCDITRPSGETDVILATGHAMEIIANSEINSTAFVENCETSAIGRALAAFGLHGGEYASADEMRNIPAKRQAAQDVWDVLGDQRKGVTASLEDVTVTYPSDDIPILNDDTIASKQIKAPETWEPEDAKRIKGLLTATASLAKNAEELIGFWHTNKDVIDMLKKSDTKGYKELTAFFKKKEAGFKGTDDE